MLNRVPWLVDVDISWLLDLVVAPSLLTTDASYDVILAGESSVYRILRSLRSVSLATVVSAWLGDVVCCVLTSHPCCCCHLHCNPRGCGLRCWRQVPLVPDTAHWVMVDVCNALICF